MLVLDGLNCGSYPHEGNSKITYTIRMAKDILDEMLAQKKHEMARRKVLEGGTGRRLTAKERHEKMREWPKLNKKAHEAAEKADPGWTNADRPSLTKGHEVFKKHNK